MTAGAVSTGDYVDFNALGKLRKQAREGSADWRRHFEESIRIASESNMRPELAISHLRYAGALAMTGDTMQARCQLEICEEMFRQIGMHWWLERADALRSTL